MNKFILIFVLLAGIGPLYAQKAINEANYLKEDSLLWMQYEHKQEELSRMWEAMPDKRDSIQRVFDEMSRKASEKNIELAIEYASVPSGLQRLYMVRLDLPKDTLQSILDSLTPEMQESFYGKNICAHLQTRQIEAGDSICPFPCVQTDGKPFDWSCTDGKQLLILYGGLGCMGKNGRNELELLYKQTSRDNLLVIVYWPCSALKYLQRVKEEYPSDYIFVSDFKQDASPMKIKYGTQATPTCFLTDKQHTVKVKCTGLHMDLFNPYIERTGL